MEIRVGGGTSIMPRVAPTLNEFVEVDNGDYLKWTEAALRIFDRQEWLRANRMRARIKVLVDKIGMDAFREMVEEELKGDWVNERDFRIDHMLFDQRGGGERAGGSRELRVAQRRQLGVRPIQGRQRPAATPGRVLDGPGTDRPRRSQPRAVPRPGRDHARVLRGLRANHRPPEPRPALGPRRIGLRRLAAAARARTWAPPAPTRSPTWSAAPARTRASSGSPARWDSTARSWIGSRRWRSTTS